MRRPLSILGLLFVIHAVSFGQGAESPTFEVASVKPATPAAGGRMGFTMMKGGPGSPDPGQITYTNIPMKLLLTRAYDVQGYQVFGPSWIDTERFDVVAKVPHGAT